MIARTVCAAMEVIAFSAAPQADFSRFCDTLPSTRDSHRKGHLGWFKFPHPITQRTGIAKVEQIRREPVRCRAIEAKKQTKEDKRDDCVEHTNKERVKEIACAKEKVVPERVDQHQREDQSERGVSQRHVGRDGEKAVKHCETHRIVKDADYHPPPKRWGMAWCPYFRQPLPDVPARAEAFQCH